MDKHAANMASEQQEWVSHGVRQVGFTLGLRGKAFLKRTAGAQGGKYPQKG